MKVFILAYARDNLGDDLFIDILVKRYPNIDFYMNLPSNEYGEGIKHFNNLTINIASDTDAYLAKMEPKQYDAYVYIGGSIFMEGGKVYNLSEEFYSFVQKCKILDIPFLYISSNFGPYQTQEYLELAKKNFKECTDICFRDLYSANLFKGIESVRYAPDIVFGKEIKVSNREEHTIGISLIDLSIRNDIQFNYDTYKNMMIDSIKEYVELGMKIKLFSFCEHEGDLRFTNELLAELSGDIKQNIKVVEYKNNLDEFINEYKSVEYMICARFHAMIMSIVCGQKLYVMSYSKKINRIVEDLKLKIKLVNFNELKMNDKINLDEFKSIDKTELNKIKEYSSEQFKKLDEIINLRK